MFKIVGNHENQQHNGALHKLIKQFVPYSQEKLGWDQPVIINLLADPENAQNPLGKTAHYEPSSKKITLFTTGRHPKDILRSLSHELVHHKQNCQGFFTSNMKTSPGYAQEDGDLRKMEEDAYLEGNMKFRDWEDGIKQQLLQQEIKQMDIDELINEMAEGYLQQEQASCPPGHAWDAEQEACVGTTAAPAPVKQTPVATPVTKRAATLPPTTADEEAEEEKLRKRLDMPPMTQKKAAGKGSAVVQKAAGSKKAVDTKAKRRGKGKRVPLSKRHGGRQMGRTLWKAMTTKAKGLGKKWSQLPYKDETRVAYRDWLAGKPVSAAMDAGQPMASAGDKLGSKSKYKVSDEGVAGLVKRLSKDPKLASQISAIARNPKHPKHKMAKAALKQFAGKWGLKSGLKEGLPLGAGLNPDETNENLEPETGSEKKWTIKHKNKKGETITLTLIASKKVYDDPKLRRREEEKARKKSDRQGEAKKKKKKKRQRVRMPEGTNENWLKEGLVDINKLLEDIVEEAYIKLNEDNVPPGWTLVPDQYETGRTCYDTPMGLRCTASPKEIEQRSADQEKGLFDPYNVAGGERLDHSTIIADLIGGSDDGEMRDVRDLGPRAGLAATNVPTDVFNIAGGENVPAEIRGGDTMTDDEKLRKLKLAGALQETEGETSLCPDGSKKIYDDQKGWVCRPGSSRGPGPKEPRKNENWYRGNKDQLLFEELTKKWTKKR